MGNFGYNVVKYWVKGGLHCYYSSIKMEGQVNIPKDKPVLFLPNHQCALMEVLLLAVDCERKPWFLTRSDVFKKPTLKNIFTYFQMIPIYRIRDGREALKKNDAVFEQCATLLENKEAILMFPEANHNIKRRVRPLSKGFTRIVFGTLDRTPDLDIQLVPVGLNYKDSERFPDKITINFGKSISVKDLYDNNDVNASTTKVKDVVAERLKTLTTHIEDEENYDDIIRNLDEAGADYLKPREVNSMIHQLNNGETLKPKKHQKSDLGPIFTCIFTLLNFPLVLGWRYWMKPKVWEPEFTATLRFAFAFLASPIYYLILFSIFAMAFTPTIGLLVILSLFCFNWLYVKLI